MRVLLCILMLAVASPVWASSISVTNITSNNVCNVNNSPNGCFEDNTVFGSDIGMDSNASASAPGVIPTNTLGSASTTFSINAVSAVDGGGDTRARLDVSYSADLVITTDNPQDEWNVDLVQGALGLFAFRGDGTASAVGNQSDGQASLSTLVVNVGGTNYNFDVSPGSRTQDCSNNCQSSTQFSGGRADGGILSGTGSQTVGITVAFSIEAFSNDGCSGFICSSVSGGEEAAALFGDQSVMDQAVDDYGTWSRALGPDGYDSTFTLNVTAVPEPGTGLLVCLGLAAYAGRRRYSA